MKATARAGANIALVKYWGKRDEALKLPTNGSISVTLDEYAATTTVEFVEGLPSDELEIDGARQEGKPLERASRFLDLVRERAKLGLRARVRSRSTVPIAAGLASSAAGFAALALAATRAADLRLPPKELSVLARLGSGSAARSVPGGFVEWRKGEMPDGSDSFAESIAPPDHMDLGLAVAVTSSAVKPVKSSEGMQRSRDTSPFYKAWLETVASDLEKVRFGVLERDLKMFGRVAERNCIKMHCVAMTADPAILYWTPATLAAMHLIQSMRRDQGMLVYFTIDAGPNVVALARQKDIPAVVERLAAIPGVERVVPCRPGPGATLAKEPGS